MALRRNILVQPGEFGGIWTALNATPTGTGNDTNANFLGATELLFAGAPALNVLAVHDAAVGSRFKIRSAGVWRAFAVVVVETAGTIFAALGFDNTDAQLQTDPALPTANAGATIAGPARSIMTAADTDTILLQSRDLFVTPAMAASATLANVRLQLSNGAGAAPAAADLDISECLIGVFRSHEIPAYLAEMD